MQPNIMRYPIHHYLDFHIEDSSLSPSLHALDSLPFKKSCVPKWWAWKSEMDVLGSDPASVSSLWALPACQECILFCGVASTLKEEAVITELFQRLGGKIYLIQVQDNRKSTYSEWCTYGHLSISLELRYVLYWKECHALSFLNSKIYIWG